MDQDWLAWALRKNPNIIWKELGAGNSIWEELVKAWTLGEKEGNKDSQGNTTRNISFLMINAKKHTGKTSFRILLVHFDLAAIIYTRSRKQNR